MVFGPESNNPRERRAYAHTMIGKFASGEANYGGALQAAYRASRTAKGSASGFEGALKTAADKVAREEQGGSGSRVIRRVPLSWQHPQDEDGYFIPLFDSRERGGRYTILEFEAMIEEDYASSDEDVPSWYMPVFDGVPAEEMGVCLYETITEGTPLTPVFPDTEQGYEDLVSYVLEHEHDASFAEGQQYSTKELKQYFFG